ncbi:phosphomevalonate kinase [bacterium]|nr:MAG: phosphomevalonate kinase [bacterium]
MITIHTPGKLMLAGEWSVLEPDNRCIVLPINRFAICQIQEATESTLSAPTLGIANAIITYENYAYKIASNDSQLFMAQAVLNTTLRFLNEHKVTLKKFNLTINTDQFFYHQQKLGFGSSAAVCVGITRALLTLHQFIADDLTIFKLATLAHYHAQKKIGSGFDIAASTYAQPLSYQRFDAAWLATQRTDSIKKIIEQPWPGLIIKPITLPQKFHMCVGFTGVSASTTTLAQRILHFKNEHTEQYQNWCTTTNKIILELETALENNKQQTIIDLINQQQKSLRNLSDLSDAQIDIPVMSSLIAAAQKHGTGAKFSGAGGGDCVIAICFENNREKNINHEWAAMGIKIINTVILNPMKKN